MVSVLGVMFWEPIPTLWLGKCEPDVSTVTPAVASVVTGSVCRKLGPFTDFHSKSTGWFGSIWGGHKWRDSRWGHITVKDNHPGIFFFFFSPTLFSIPLLNGHRTFINYAKQLVNHLLICKHSLRVSTCNPSRLSSISFKHIYIFLQLITQMCFAWFSFGG